MLSKFRGKCATCHGVIEAGTEIDYDAKNKQAHHKECRQSGGCEDPESIANDCDFATAEELAGDWSVLFLRWRNRDGSERPVRSDDTAQGDASAIRPLFASEDGS